MRITCAGNKIEIQDVPEGFKHRNIAQLLYWGFRLIEEESSFTFLGDPREILPRVVQYFDNVGINLEISDSCRHYIYQADLDRKLVNVATSKGREFKDGIVDSAGFEDHRDFLNTALHRTLKEHQVKASFHLYTTINGANFSVPGSGKTTVVLSVFERLRQEGKVNTLFVIGPPSCFGPWKVEFEAVFGRKPNIVILAGGDKLARKGQYYATAGIADIYLTTFQTLQNDVTEVAFFLNNPIVNAYVVIDEAHYIKRLEGNWASSALEISRHAKYRCVLTGTPMPKSYSDLFNLYEFLWPGMNIIPEEDRIRLKIFEENKDFASATSLLEPKIGPLFYRVRKADLNLSPQVMHDPILVEMQPIERQVYDAIVNRIKDYSREDYLRNIEFVDALRRGRMVRIRQCFSYARLTRTAIDGYDEDLFANSGDLRNLVMHYDQHETPGKLQELLKMLNEIKLRDEKVVVWAHFIDTLALIEKTLQEKGFENKKIIGETPIERLTVSEAETREKIISVFLKKDSGVNILLANPAACAESISLHKSCHNAIYYDLSFNAAQFLQSLDRIHRVGGSENQEAHYYFLQYENSIESLIIDNLREKAEKMARLVDSEYAIYSSGEYNAEIETEIYQQLTR